MAIAALCDGLHSPVLLPSRLSSPGERGGGDFCALLTESYKSYIQEFLRGIIKAGTSPESGQLGKYDLSGSELHPTAGTSVQYKNTAGCDSGQRLTGVPGH